MNVVSSMHAILQTSGVLCVLQVHVCVHGIKCVVCMCIFAYSFLRVHKYNMHKHAHYITYVAVSFLVFSEIQLVRLCTKKTMVIFS